MGIVETGCVLALENHLVLELCHAEKERDLDAHPLAGTKIPDPVGESAHFLFQHLSVLVGQTVHEDVTHHGRTA